MATLAVLSNAGTLPHVQQKTVGVAGRATRKVIGMVEPLWPAGATTPAQGATDADPTTPLFAHGFTNLDREYTDLELPVAGRLPPWLHGRLLRNGPARFVLPKGAVAHWFDGLAMLHAFTFAHGHVRYSNRFLHSTAYRHAQAQGAPGPSVFTVDPGASLFRRILTGLFPYQLDNANIAITQVDGRFLALTETPQTIAFDPATLHTIGAFRFRDRLRGHLTTAHPLYDATTGVSYTYLTRFGLPSRYQIVTLGTQRRLVGSLPVTAPGYMHSFAMTERYLVLSEFPFLLNLRAIFSAEVPLIGSFRWRPERATRFLVLDKHTGALVDTYAAEACFGFHHVNAYESAEGLVLDLVVYPNPTVIDQFYLATLKQHAPMPAGELRRYVLPHQGRSAHYTVVSPVGLELPQIDERQRSRRHRYVYGAGVSQRGAFFDQIVRVDTEQRAALIWSEHGCYPGEPIFVPDPGADAEGAGLLLIVVLDGRCGTSFLLVLDATTLVEVGRARMAHHIPFGLHGMYV